MDTVALTATGSTQATAAEIKGIWSPALIISAGDSLLGIRLPGASKGKMFAVKNTGPAGGFGGLNVYPATGGAINALSTNAPLVMSALSSAWFIASTDGLTWHTIPTIPS